MSRAFVPKKNRCMAAFGRSCTILKDYRKSGEEFQNETEKTKDKRRNAASTGRRGHKGCDYAGTVPSTPRAGSEGTAEQRDRPLFLRPWPQESVPF